MGHTIKAGQEEHYKPTSLKFFYVLLADERKPLSKLRDEIERSETRRKEVAKKHGLPMT